MLLKENMLFFLHFSSTNPSRPLFLSRYDPIVKAFGCFAVPWMQRELVWRDWAVGDWVWNGAGQPQGIWTGLMDLFETCRGYEQWGSPWGHVYSEPSRACRMPIHFPSNLSKCSTTYGCHWALSLGGNLKILPGKLCIFKKCFWFERPSELLTVRFLQRSRMWHIYSDSCSGLRLFRPAAPRFIFKPRRIASHISLSLGQLSECAPTVNKSSKASQSD